ncbi:MAG: hypothetical protein JOZ96_24280 [Acidobacteria bacterium]|nr:hypothetical protein [Acidobacteriota bacterium]
MEEAEAAELWDVRRRRFKSLLTGLIAVLLIITSIALISFDWEQYFGRSAAFNLKISGYILALISGGIVYVKIFTDYLESNPERRLKADLRYQIDLKNELTMGEILRRVDNLDDSLNNIGTVKFDLADLDKEQLVETLRTSLNNKLNENAFKSIDEAFAKRDLQHKKLEAFVLDFEKIKSRLVEETGNLAKRSNLNLAFGSLTTIVAGLGLVVVVFFTPLDLSGVSAEQYGWKIVAHYVPRLSLIVFAEIFAYFFLKLYKTGLSDIKYYQNEITNVELKLTALRAALSIDDIDILGSVIVELAKTERNFILKTGETTIELEKLKMDAVDPKDWIEKVAALIKNKVT